MVVLGGGRFLMSEVPLYSETSRARAGRERGIERERVREREGEEGGDRE